MITMTLTEAELDQILTAMDTRAENNPEVPEIQSLHEKLQTIRSYDMGEYLAHCDALRLVYTARGRTEAIAKQRLVDAIVAQSKRERWGLPCAATVEGIDEWYGMHTLRLGADSGTWVDYEEQR